MKGIPALFIYDVCFFTTFKYPNDTIPLTTEKEVRKTFKMDLEINNIFKKKKIAIERLSQKKNKDSKIKKQESKKKTKQLKMKRQKIERYLSDKKKILFFFYLERLIQRCNLISVAEVLNWSGNYD